MNIKSVCKNCADRYLGCHDHCQKYQQAKTGFWAEKTVVYEGRKKEADFNAYYKDLARKLRGKK